LANGYRSDLAEAGIGAGCHAFTFVVPEGGLSPLQRHVIAVRRAGDGRDLAGSPCVLEAAGGFDEGMQALVAKAVDAVGSSEERARVLSFVVEQADRLLQQAADEQAGREKRLAARQFRRRWGDSRLDIDAPDTRALVVAEGGCAPLMGVMGALGRLGYAVSFVSSDLKVPEGEIAAGISVCASPFYASVEDVLRRQAGCFEVIWLQGAAIAQLYLPLARLHGRPARILFGAGAVRPDASRQMRLAECTAAWSADAVIAGSAADAALLRRMVPGATVYTIEAGMPAGSYDLALRTALSGPRGAADTEPVGIRA
jgi:hypothetical protein